MVLPKMTEHESLKIMFMKYTVLTFSLLMLSACTTTLTSNPARTATEELLISTAAERAASHIVLQIPPETVVFIDNSNFEGTDSKYAIAAIRNSFLRQG